MKLVSWNVNGLRAVHRKGFSKWFEEQAADVVCLQEIKTFSHQLPEELINPLKHNSYWHSAEKPGYSGVAIYSKSEPLDVRYGLGKPGIDREGRVVIAEYKNLTVINSYFPNSQREHTRLPYKLDFCNEFATLCKRELEKGKSLYMCGDLNVAHEEIDLANPKTNKRNAGFLPEERAWMTAFLKSGYTDAFREFEKGGGHYTWWSNRPGVRERNIGWRLDYFLTDSESKSRLKSMYHQTQVLGSDHGPVRLEIKS